MNLSNKSEVKQLTKNNSQELYTLLARTKFFQYQLNWKQKSTKGTEQIDQRPIHQDESRSNHKFIHRQFRPPQNFKKLSNWKTRPKGRRTNIAKSKLPSTAWIKNSKNYHYLKLIQKMLSLRWLVAKYTWKSKFKDL